MTVNLPRTIQEWPDVCGVLVYAVSMQIGGFLGLLLGASALTIVEVLDFMVVKYVFKTTTTTTTTAPDAQAAAPGDEQSAAEQGGEVPKHSCLSTNQAVHCWERSQVHLKKDLKSQQLRMETVSQSVTAVNVSRDVQGCSATDVALKSVFSAGCPHCPICSLS